MRRSIHRPITALATTTLLALVAGACSSDSKDASTATAATSTTAAAAVTTAAPASSAAPGDTTGATTAATEDTTAATTAATEDTTAATTAATEGTTAPTTPADPLGTPNKATGSKVKIGFISDGQSAAIDNTSEELAGEASFKYVNDYLGGVAGHEIDVDLCETKQDPAIAADCANQMVQDGVAAVLWSVSGQAAAIAGPIQAAGIPMFVFVAADKSVAASTTSFIMANGLSTFVFPAAVAQANKFTKAAWIVIDVPAATGPITALAGPIMANAGVPAVDLIKIAPGTADMGPQVQAELANGPQLVHIFGNASFCATAIQALHDAGFTGVITAISNCIDPTTIEAVGAGLEGVQVAYAATEDPADPDYQLFLAIRDKYGDPSKIDATGSAVGTFSVVVSFARLMQGVTGDVTPASILERARTAPPLPLAGGAGATFQCNGKAIAIIPAGCSTGFVGATLGADGKPATFAPVVVGDLLKLG